jgi:tol-pal system protein YbgF
LSIVSPIDKRRRRLAGAAGLALAMGVAGLALAAPGDDPAARLDRLETQTTAIETQIQGLTGDPVVATAPRLRLAQSRELAQINVRLDQLEERMRVLTGQVEGLQFQLTQLQALIERMQEDNEFRFQALEGGEPGKTEAAPQSAGEMPGGEVPPETVVPDRLPEEPETVAPIDTGDSLDPLLGDPEDPDAGILGTLPADIFDQPLQSPQFGGEDVTAPVDRITDADAVAQFNAGREAQQRGDAQFAEAQFRQFISVYPDHRLAAEASNRLGELLIARGEYDEAAQVLVVAFEAYPRSDQAPALLLNLGVSLAGAGERETACRTYVEVLRRYPDAPQSFIDRVGREQRSAQC